MGQVYKARDTRLNRHVAIKFLSDELADVVARRRFQREAQTASSLNHPHILTVHDVGEVEGRQYIVTEFVDGGTLRDWAERERRTWRQVVELLTGVADGLAAAHEARILHRDIKPGNILIAKNGYAKLADFGLAKLEEEPGPSAETGTFSQRQTRAGVVIGTVAYMSPEQASGQKLDARSDIFSFGVVLYELLAGKRPFEGANDLDLLKVVIHGTSAPLSESLPMALRLAVDKALAKDPAERYQTMREVAVDLRRALHYSAKVPVRELPVRPPIHRWVWVALALLVLGGLSVWRWWPTSPPAEPLTAVALTTLPGVESYPSFSPEGDRVAFMWTGSRQDNPDIYIQQIGSGSPSQRTTHPGSDFSPVWSPDGRWVAFLRHQSSAFGTLQGKAELLLLPPTGGPEKKLAEIQMAPQPAVAMGFLSWCPDSKCLVVAESTGLFAISLDTVKSRLTTAKGSSDTDPAFSPDGTALVFRRNLSINWGELHWLPIGKGPVPAGEPVRLTPAARGASFPAWMPDGKEILFSASGSLWKLRFTGEKSDEPTPERLPFVGEDGFMPAIAPARGDRPPRLVYVRDLNDINIWRVEIPAPGLPSVSVPTVLVASTRGDVTPMLSPNGSRLAYISNRLGNWEVWVSDRDGSNPDQLTSMGAVVTGSPAWSPDGQKIAFHSNLEGQFEVYVINASGGMPDRLTFDPLRDGFPTFSQDGRWVYFQSGPVGQNDIWKIPSSGGEASKVAPDAQFPVESRDGYLYSMRGNYDDAALWRAPVSGGEPVKVVEGIFAGAFAVVEKGIYYIERTPGENRLQFFDLKSRKSTLIARNLGNPFIGALTVSADGRTILYSRLDSSIQDLMLVENFR